MRKRELGEAEGDALRIKCYIICALYGGRPWVRTTHCVLTFDVKKVDASEMYPMIPMIVLKWDR